MPARVARSIVPSAPAASSRQRSKKRRQRGLDALSIASRLEEDEAPKRRHRLGETEDDEPQTKRQRVDGIEDEDGKDGWDEDASRLRKKTRVEESLDVDSGSDGEGNKWRMGEVADGEDSDLDSDEAFGESDEERFGDYVFRGSRSRASRRKVTNGSKAKLQGEEEDVDMEDDDDDDDDDDLGEDAVDLATMLDDGDEQSASEVSEQENINDDESAASQASDSAMSASEDEDGENVDKLHQLQDIVASLPKPSSEGNSKKVAQPTAASMLAAFRAAGLSSALNRTSKRIVRDIETGTVSKNSDLVKVPLPKRQQDRLDRVAAYTKAKETLGRWVDTVKHNRRAEHLEFPLSDPNAQTASGTTRFIPATQQAPMTDLEATIQNIMTESGLSRSGKSDEQMLQETEELQTKKMNPEEVFARRAELRQMRELLFREEVKAKRIKKIKSKSYRRVHRKEALKAAKKERDILLAAGVDLSEEEREDYDRKRAEERMGGRHRESRWAKAMKQTGRTAWDEDALDAVNEMARKNEELRMRAAGKKIAGDNGGDGDSSDSDDGASLSGSDEDERQRGRLQQKLRDLNGDSEPAGVKSKLASMPFILRADAERKKRNDDDIEQLHRELAGQEGLSESEEEQTVGRMIFGSNGNKQVEGAKDYQLQEFEERFLGDEEEEEGPSTEQRVEEMDSPEQRETIPNPIADLKAPRQQQKSSVVDVSAEYERNKGKAKAFEVKPVPSAASDDFEGFSDDEPISSSTKAPPESKHWSSVQISSTAPDTDTHNGTHDDDDDASSTGSSPFIAPSNLDLVRAAFGTDATEEAFAIEKAAAAESEDDKVIDHSLPGWGSWTGEGVTKRENKAAAAYKARNKARLTTVEKGVRPDRRHDAKLAKVIISEKRIGKNAKYLASTLPHPFETRQQYERSLRLPIGPEWTTKETFQGATKPRLLVKQGVIKPMETPML